jgi:hypothetical protein
MDCSICLGQIKENHEFYLLCNCNYCYHYECISDWRCIKNICPICKKSLHIPDLDERIDICIENIINSIYGIFLYIKDKLL